MQPIPPLKRPILTVLFASFVFSTTLLWGLLTNDHVQVSIFNKDLTPHRGVAMEVTMRIDPEAYSPDPEVDLSADEGVYFGKYGEWSYCDYEEAESPTYAVSLSSVEVQTDIMPGDIFLVDMLFTNTGTARLYSADSECYDQPILNLGTQNTQDRASVFGVGQNSISGWESSTRVKMVEDYVEPGETFHMSFQSIAPEGDNVYREFFQPVVENVAWIGESFGFDVIVGTPTESMKDNISFVTDVSVAASELEGLERNMEITLDDQMMYARFGEIRVWSMQISSGAWDTPTPQGDYQVLTKQELRIGVAYPHYRMPYFQLWDWRGYGLHALPYLANDGGAFWSEALDHIGRPVSHGCVRMLPDDAVTAYNFTDIGTPIWIH